MAAALVPLVCSCSREQASGTGYLNAVLGQELSTLQVTRSAVPVTEAYALSVTHKTTGARTLVTDHRTLAGHPLELQAGTYSVKAWNGSETEADPPAAVWNRPCYGGEATVSVLPGRVSTASLTCSLLTTKVSVAFPSEMDAFFTEYEVAVDNGKGETLRFGNKAGHLSDTAFFAVTGTLGWTLAVKNRDGKIFTTERESYRNVKPRQHYHLSFSLSELQDAGGAAVLTIRLDGSVHVKRHTFELDLSATGFPEITSENLNLVKEPDGRLSGKANTVSGSPVPVSLLFRAEKGMNNLQIRHSDPKLAAAGLPYSTDLVGASDVAALNGLGIACSPVPFGTTSARVDLTDFIGRLPVGDYALAFRLADAKNHECECALSLYVRSAVEAEASDVEPWARFAVLRGKWYTDLLPAGLRFQYRKASDGEWTECAAPLLENASGKTVVADLTGLEPETDYAVRLISDEDTETREILFRTEPEGTVHNLDFDSWFKDGKCWYPDDAAHAQAESRVWDSANPGTANLLIGAVVPTTPEDSDLAVSGSGKRAARLESMTTFGQFVAGNLYLGKFGKVVGLGAELDWGEPFTSRPVALRGYYKYSPALINKVKDPYKSLEGQTDIGQIRILLTDWSSRFHINTSQGIFIRDDDPGIVASGELLIREASNGYVRFTLPLKYRSTDRTPTFLVLSGAASRYGDYFTGGVGSVLLLDEFGLVYDIEALTESERAQVAYR